MHAIQCNAATKYFYESDDTNNNSSGIIARLGRKKKKKIMAVDNISLEVARGEMLGIVGPNGSGKSTFIRMLSTLILPDHGQLTIFGKDVVRESISVRKNINRVSVDAAFFKRLSAWENLSYAARLYGLSLEQARSRAIEILAGMNFKIDRMYQPLENMSRGMQQKVAIARALFTSPVVLLLDEPTTGLDPVSKRQVQQYVMKMREIHDTTVLLTSHDMEEVERTCDRVAIIDKGRLVGCDTPGKLKRLYGNGKDTTLEDIFIKLTGRSLEQDYD